MVRKNKEQERSNNWEGVFGFRDICVGGVFCGELKSGGAKGGAAWFWVSAAQLWGCASDWNPTASFRTSYVNTNIVLSGLTGVLTRVAIGKSA